MPVLLIKAVVLLIPATALLVGSVAALKRLRTPMTLLWFIGAACFVVVVLTHIAEAEQWFPLMRWGEPDSAGHYLDLLNAVIGAACLASSVALLIRSRSQENR